MGDNLVLRFQYSGKDTDVIVADIDKVNIIDLINEYWENSKKEGHTAPKYPEFSYVYKMKHNKVKTDKDLVQMFQNLRGRELIYLWVVDAPKPTVEVEAAIKLREMYHQTFSVQYQAPTVEVQNSTNQPTDQAQPKVVSPRRNLRRREVIIESTPPQPTPDKRQDHIVVQSQLTQTPREKNLDLNMPVSPRYINELVVDNMEYWQDIQIEPFEQDLNISGGRAKLRGSGRGQGQGRGVGKVGEVVVRRSPRTKVVPAEINIPAIGSRQNMGVSVEVGENSLNKMSSPMFKKRVPRTSAVRKGVFKPQSTRKNEVAVSLSESMDLAASLDLDEDTVYTPSHCEESEDDVSLTEEDGDAHMPFVDSVVGGRGSDEGRSVGGRRNVGVRTGERDGDSDEYVSGEENDIPDQAPDYIYDQFDPYDNQVWVADHEELDDAMHKMYRNGQLYQEEEGGQIVLKPWQLFVDKDHLRSVVRDHCIQAGFAIVVEQASNFKYTIRCSDARCMWRLHASKLIDGVTWAIKSINPSEHSCLGLETRNPMVTSKWAASALIEDIRANENIPGKALNELLWSRYRTQMAKSTLYRAKSVAMQEIHGGHDTSYSDLPAYCQAIVRTNPNSVAKCSWYPQHHPERPMCFKNIFIAFRGAVEGFLAGCRGLVGVDGTFLKGNYGGVLLSAIALDGNNEMFPIAWAIVSGEDEETWKFFIWNLKQVLDEGGRGDNNLCIISDRHKAIEAACRNVWPGVGRRYCTKHLSVNFKKCFPGPKMEQLFWLACGASSEFSFEKAMKQISKHKEGARVWLANLGEQERWTKHKFNVHLKCDVNKTNFVESFNATLGVDRTRPVLTLLEGIRRVTMVRLATRRELCDKWERSDVCPNIVKRVQHLCSESRTCVAHKSGPGEYEIVDGKSSLPVSLNNHTCICNAWQLTGIPCKHGMRAILYAGLDPLKFVHEWYSVKRYKMAYGSSIHPIPDKEQWDMTQNVEILPPIMKRGAGRPVKNRKRGEEEKRKGKRSCTIKCGNCSQFGHNRVTCQHGPTAKQVKAAKVAGDKGKGGASTSGGTNQQASKPPLNKASAAAKGKAPV